MLTFGEVASAVSEVDVDESDIEELYGYLEGQGVEMVDDVDPAQTATADAMPAEPAKKASAARNRRST